MPGMDQQGLVTALASACPPRTDTEALVLMVQAVCLIGEEMVLAKGTAAGPLSRPVEGTQGLTFPLQAYDTPHGYRVFIKPLVEDRGIDVHLHCHASLLDATASTTERPPRSHRICVRTVDYVFPSLTSTRGDVTITKTMDGAFQKLRRRIVSDVLSKLPCFNPSSSDGTGATNSSCLLTSLPAPLLYETLLFVSAYDTARLSRACKAFEAAAENPALWKAYLGKEPGWAWDCASGERHETPYQKYTSNAKTKHHRDQYKHPLPHWRTGIYTPVNDTKVWSEPGYVDMKHAGKHPYPFRAHHTYTKVKSGVFECVVGPYGY